MQHFMATIQAQMQTAQQNILTVVISPGHLLAAKALWSDGQFIACYPQASWDFWQKTDIKSLKINKINTVNQENVFVQPLKGMDNLIICGGGHISLAVAEIGYLLGFKITVIDDRIDFANSHRFPAAQVICGDFLTALQSLTITANTYLVVATRGHLYDKVCLSYLLTQDYAYLGMVSSKSRAKLLKKELLTAGCAEEQLERIYTPIGLNIGGQTPAEIGVSIWAEIIELKNSAEVKAVASEDIWQFLLNHHQPQALVTIIERRGSAPRDVGSQMVICADGSGWGTIGGGCLEAEARQLALAALDRKQAQIGVINMTPSEAGDEGMVCGGMVRVLVEPID